MLTVIDELCFSTFFNFGSFCASWCNFIKGDKCLVPGYNDFIFYVQIETFYPPLIVLNHPLIQQVDCDVRTFWVDRSCQFRVVLASILEVENEHTSDAGNNQKILLIIELGMVDQLYAGHVYCAEVIVQLVQEVKLEIG